MAFIRRKTTNGKAYYYLVEAKRVNGRSKQTTIAALGRHRTLLEAIKAWEQKAAALERAFEYFTRAVALMDAFNRAWNKALPEFTESTWDKGSPDFTNLSIWEVIAMCRVARLGSELTSAFNRFGEGLDGMLLLRQEARQLRAKVEVLRAYERGAKKPEKRPQK